MVILNQLMIMMNIRMGAKAPNSIRPSEEEVSPLKYVPKWFISETTSSLLPLWTVGDRLPEEEMLVSPFASGQLAFQHLCNCHIFIFSKHLG